MLLLLCIILSFRFLPAWSQSIQPPAIPLAVRSPYLQAYLSHTSTTTAANGSIQWPYFWTTNYILGWAGLLRVDGAYYNWLGADPNVKPNATLNTATLNGYQVTPTRSILSLSAGLMAINITFLSPIEPEDLVLQSFPFSYIYFEASSTDGNPHSLQVYQDITNGHLPTVPIQCSNLQYMAELDNMAEDGVAYHVTNAGSGVTYQNSEVHTTREAFLNNGKLNNTQDGNFRAIQNNLPVFAFSSDLGTITSTSSPVVWGIGLVRSRDIVYTTTTGNQTRQPYFFTRYSDVPTAMSDFMNNASSALQRAIALDNKIVSDAKKISSDYTDLVSLASRQVMAGMEITVGIDSNGKLNSSDVLIFMKDTGNTQRTNPVEVLYAALPAILYFNASWAGYLLKPLLQYESSGLYTKDFAANDLGNTFPSAIGNSNPTLSLAMEYIGDMLIMAWAHATFSGD
ncbi:hypothetical protein GYMLUDRAFT_239519 [Collybiopsis luxurians FD-317 M1]|nr:hypothetical protein GYMLUDRAFT_239519 [Collybiopsis luxurians FD-317 M1]